MKQRVGVALGWVLAVLLLSAPAHAADDAAAIQQAIRNNYAAYSGFDEQKYRATTTKDYVLLENGELIDREGDVASMAKPNTGFRRTDDFEFHSVTIEGALGYAVYVLRSEIYDDTRGARSREWLESAILRRVDGDWKMALLHSTRVSHPAGAKDMKSFATRYTAAWNSQDPASVAAFHGESSSLTINNGAPSVGRAAITEAARSFMTAFPEMFIELDGIDRDGDQYRYRWTLTGTNTGPGGSGRKVRISGFEEWSIGADGLIARSLGHYDAADYARQINGN